MSIRSLETLPGTLETRPVTIVGAGAVGIALAVYLAQRGVPTTLLEGGPRKPPVDYERFNPGRSTGRPHRGIRSGRLKAYGGTSRLWGGQLVPFDANDLDARDAEGHKLWPIGFADLEPWLASAYDLLSVPPEARETGRIWSRATGLDLDFGPELTTTMNIWLSQPDFTRLFHDRLEGSSLIDVVTDARLERLAFSEKGTVESATFRAPSGREQTIRPGTLVLANGTIEIAVTLLAAQAGAPNCPFADNAHVGRWYLDHLHGYVGTVDCADPALISAAFDNIRHKGLKYNVKLRSRRRAGEPGVALTLNSTVTLSSLLREGTDLARRAFRHPGSAGSALAGGVRTLRLALPAALRYIAGSRPKMITDGLLLGMELEQLPHYESRIMLDPGAEGAIPMIHWQLGGAELPTMHKRCLDLKQAFERTGLGSVTIDPLILAEDPAAFDLFHDSSHQMGGARMAASAERGVVDEVGRVFGTNNLYVAGAATFPSGSCANSTLTAIALSLRLGDRLADGVAGAGDRLMPRLVYGTARLAGGISARSSAALVRQVLDAGVRAIDTAPLYGMGSAEDVVGAALRTHPAGKEVFVIAKTGRPRPSHPFVRSLLRAGKRLVRPTPPRDLSAWSPAAKRPGSTDGVYDSAGMRTSVESSLARLGGFDALLLHEPSAGDFGAAVDTTLRELAAEQGARVGYGWGASIDPDQDAVFPDDYLVECAYPAEVMAGCAQPPAREAIFHSIAAVAEHSALGDSRLAAALDATAEMVPGATKATARIAAALLVAAIRAPEARLVFSSTSPQRLGELLAALNEIDARGLWHRTAAMLGAD